VDVDTSPPPSDLVRVRRHPERGRYDRASVEAILDEGLICHLGFVSDGRPWVLPTIHARVREHLYLHGAVGNHALRALAGGAPACVTVSLVDGLVLARSAFAHSLNYRSVVVTGTATLVDDPAEKRQAFEALVEHVVPGRTADARAASDSELRQTAVLRIPITEASAKVRTGPPIDKDDADLDLPVWAGVVPLRTVAGLPEPDEHVPPHVPLPAYLPPPSRTGG
jgi:uncharacterized protein